jgi:mannosyltransferase OCH1-like enzyme
MNKVEILYNKLINKTPFCFIKMNDGECQAIIDENAILARGLEKSSGNMSNKLKECFQFNDPNYFIGIPCSVCFPDLKNKITPFISEEILPNNILNANILINSNINSTLNVFKENFANKQIIVIANKTMINNIDNLKKININVSKTIAVSDKYAFDNDYDKIKDEWKNVENNSIIICLCGPLGRIICYEWFKNNNTLTCLELGSFFDPLLINKSYLYHTSTLRYCSECNPINEINKSELLNHCDNKSLNSECYYFNSLEDSLCFYNNNYEKVLINAKNRFKKEPNNSVLKDIIYKCNEREFKKCNVWQMYNKANHFYNYRNLEELDCICDLYLKYFEHYNDDRYNVLKIRFYSGIANFYSNKEKAIKHFEYMYNDNRANDDDIFYSKCNLINLYNALHPTNNEPIPKTIHLIYFKEKEIKDYNYRCIMSMIYNLPDYNIIIYNDIEPTDNIYWNKLKINEKITIKYYERPRVFDGFNVQNVQYSADIARLEILYNYGGVYLDLDMLVINNFVDIFKDNNDFYISKESENGDGLINSFLASKPKNEFIKLWLDCFATGLRTEKWAYHISTSNKLLLEKNKHFMIKYKIKIINSYHFFPIFFDDAEKFKNNKVFNFKKDTYGIHLWDSYYKNTISLMDTLPNVEKQINVSEEYKKYFNDISISHKNVCFICNYNNEINNVNKLLEKLNASTLIDKLDKIIILNIGSELKMHEIINVDNVNCYNLYQIINCLNETTLCEIQAINIVRIFSEYNENVKILYLNDCNNNFAHSLIEKSNKIHFIMENNDVVGYNVVNSPYKHFEENCWWANTNYIRNLSLVYSNTKDIVKWWILSLDDVKYNSLNDEMLDSIIK